MTDLTYQTIGMFTQFLPETKEGEQAWRELATVTQGTGKVLTIQAKQFISDLRKAGYKVTKAKTVKFDEKEFDSFLEELEI